MLFFSLSWFLSCVFLLLLWLLWTVHYFFSNTIQFIKVFFNEKCLHFIKLYSFFFAAPKEIKCTTKHLLTLLFSNFDFFLFPFLWPKINEKKKRSFDVVFSVILKSIHWPILLNQQLILNHFALFFFCSNIWYFIYFVKWLSLYDMVDSILYRLFTLAYS